LKKTNNNIHSEEVTYNRFTAGDLGLNLFVTGFVSTSVQLLLLREMMNITGGYELISGSFLASWLITSSAGAAFAGRSRFSNLKIINALFAAGPIVSLVLLLILSRALLGTGQTPSFLTSFIFTLAVLLPFCFISGYTFVKLLGAARSLDMQPGRSFSVETAGGILSGIVISLLTSGILNTYELLFLIIIAANSYSFLTFFVSGKISRLSVKIITVILISFVLLLNTDNFFRQILLPGVNVISTHDTPYGNITKGEYGGEASTYYNQRLLTYSGDAQEIEEDVHYAMLQSGNPKRVMMISGSLRAHLPELLKYPLEKIIYIERDPALTEPEKNIPKQPGTDIGIVNDDAFTFIRRSKEKVDAILLLVLPPSTLLLNRYYSTEFFRYAKRALGKDGIFVCSPGPSQTYYNEESLVLYSSVFSALKQNFRNVVPIAGNKLYLLASDSALTTSVAGLTKNKNIRNIYVSPDYLSDDLIESKSEELISEINQDAKPNRAVFPVAYFGYQAYTFSRDSIEKTPAIALLITLFAIPAFGFRRQQIIMYSGASALAGFEIIMLLTLQLIAGNMYQLTGLIIAGLMAGLAVGTALNRDFKASLITRGLLLMTFYLLTGMCFNLLMKIGNAVVATTIILIISFIPAFITGSIFRVLSGINNEQVFIAGVYSADLAGSALGFILVTGFIIPAYGIRASVLCLAILILAGMLTGIIRNKK
jgi:spermidine synthase